MDHLDLLTERTKADEGAIGQVNQMVFDSQWTGHGAFIPYGTCIENRKPDQTPQSPRGVPVKKELTPIIREKNSGRLFAFSIDDVGKMRKDGCKPSRVVGRDLDRVPRTPLQFQVNCALVYPQNDLSIDHEFLLI